MALRNAGIITFAVGIGRAIPEELDMVSGSPDRTFFATDFVTLTDTVLDSLQDIVCAGEKFCAVLYWFLLLSPKENERN